ncbi:hypothetical protein [Bacillus sp. V5-8f]|uniref:hypothetical protein n=1 Tax=Bacillus sp. V5-8f TaxID=2053044 RepID=UPI000C78D156|nr:hypothetical protein [Bacillus sp. V5-8f]PLT32937.1 hypothetical protein CUU64_15990 [Bacillus sp. V5-8f]
MVNYANSNSIKKENKIAELEKQVSLGLWIQSIGQIIELSGLSGLLQLEDGDLTGEKQILSGVWIKTIGQVLEAISVSRQIGETDKAKLFEEQKIAITGDLLVSIGAAIEVAGGIKALSEEGISGIPLIIP